MRLRTFGSVAMTVALLAPGATVMAQEESPAAEATMSPVAEAFAATFPDEIGGVSVFDIVEVFVADDPDQLDAASLPLLEQAAAAAGVGLDAVLIGQALTIDLFDEDAEGVWIVAIHVPGMEPAAGTDLVLDLFTGSADEELLVAGSEVAGRSVTSVTSAEDPSAEMIIYSAADTAWVVMSPSPALLEEAVSKLP